MWETAVVRPVGRVLAAVAAFLFWTITAHAYPASTTADLNMRSGPGTQYTVITVIPAGAPVEVVGCSGGMVRHRLGLCRGYVSERFLASGYVPPRPPAVAPPPFPPVVSPRPPVIAPPPGTRPVPPSFGRGCDERGATWALGQWASPRTVDEAGRSARARTVRVIRPGDPVTRDYRRDRLTIEVDFRNRIRDLSCG